MTVSIDQDLKEILSKIKQDLKTIQKDVTDIKVELGALKSNIQALDTKVDGIDKRLEKVEASQKNQIWALIGILGTVVLATVFRFLLSSLPNNP